MIRTVDHGDFYVDHREPGNHAGLTGLLHAHFGGLDEFLGNDTANDFVDEFKTGFRFTRLHFDHNVAVLTLTTGLTRELAFASRCRTDGFAVGDLRRTDIGFNFEFAQHPVDQDLQMQLSHARDHGLASL
ncbi:MAG: Uncharacterised protein [Cyanobium sp. ARS6]|nr:MAG: Uncharacterised protein [Cyanobium sp. ARS6]